jgi:hypothetical protein
LFVDQAAGQDGDRRHVRVLRIIGEHPDDVPQAVAISDDRFTEFRGHLVLGAAIAGIRALGREQFLDCQLELRGGHAGFEPFLEDVEGVEELELRRRARAVVLDEEMEVVGEPEDVPRTVGDRLQSLQIAERAFPGFDRFRQTRRIPRRRQRGKHALHQIAVIEQIHGRRGDQGARALPVGLRSRPGRPVAGDQPPGEFGGDPPVVAQHLEGGHRVLEPVKQLLGAGVEDRVDLAAVGVIHELGAHQPARGDQVPEAGVAHRRLAGQKIPGLQQPEIILQGGATGLQDGLIQGNLGVDDEAGRRRRFSDGKAEVRAPRAFQQVPIDRVVRPRQVVEQIEQQGAQFR